MRRLGQLVPLRGPLTVARTEPAPRGAVVERALDVRVIHANGGATGELHLAARLRSAREGERRTGEQKGERGIASEPRTKMHRGLLEWIGWALAGANAGVPFHGLGGVSGTARRRSIWGGKQGSQIVCGRSTTNMRFGYPAPDAPALRPRPGGPARRLLPIWAATPARRLKRAPLVPCSRVRRSVHAAAMVIQWGSSPHRGCGSRPGGGGPSWGPDAVARPDRRWPPRDRNHPRPARRGPRRRGRLELVRRRQQHQHDAAHPRRAARVLRSSRSPPACARRSSTAAT